MNSKINLIMIHVLNEENRADDDFTFFQFLSIVLLCRIYFLELKEYVHSAIKMRLSFGSTSSIICRFLIIFQLKTEILQAILTYAWIIHTDYMDRNSFRDVP